MLELAFTHIQRETINDEGDYNVVWYYDDKVVHKLTLRKHELSDHTLIGHPPCPACLVYRGIVAPMTERTIFNKPFCITCGGELIHLSDACSCGQIPHTEECQMWNEGISSN